MDEWVESSEVKWEWLDGMRWWNGMDEIANWDERGREIFLGKYEVSGDPDFHLRFSAWDCQSEIGFQAHTFIYFSFFFFLYEINN